MSEEAQSNDNREKTVRAQEAKRSHEEALMAKANVVGVGVGLIRRGGATTEEVGIIVMVTRKRPASQLSASDLVPRELDGVPVDVQEVGEIRAQ